MKMPSIDKICNIAGCVLIFVLLALLVFKPSGVMSLLEGNSPNTNKPTNNNNNNNVNRNNNNVNRNRNRNNNNKNSNNTNVNTNVKKSAVRSSNPLGENEQFAAVTGIKTPTRSCYPQDSLSPKELLPKDEKDNIANFNKDYPISEGILKGVNFLEAGYQVGVNTVGQSLRNANRQVRSEPPNPQVSVSPWMNTTIGPDLARAPLEIGEDCYASIGNNTL
tara:strand:- start:1436 stop:2095 length:660 start_codon:yes stop_codon:yes gene_type:complete